MTDKVNAAEIRELQQTIEAITDRKCVSKSLPHLRRRIAMLRKDPNANRAEWRARRDHDPDRTAPSNPLLDPGMWELLIPHRGELLRRVAAKTNATIVDVLRRAVDEYAVRLGLGADVERAKKGGA